MTQEPQNDAVPASNFVTREGKTIALKAWTLHLIAQHASSIAAFVQVWAEIGTDGSATLDSMAAVIPAIEASVQSPDSLVYVIGLAEQVRLVEAIWAYNEIGVGLGKALALSAQIQEQIMGQSTDLQG